MNRRYSYNRNQLRWLLAPAFGSLYSWPANRFVSIKLFFRCKFPAFCWSRFRSFKNWYFYYSSFSGLNFHYALDVKVRQLPSLFLRGKKSRSCKRSLHRRCLRKNTLRLRLYFIHVSIRFVSFRLSLSTLTIVTRCPKRISLHYNWPTLMTYSSIALVHIIWMV